MKRVTTNMSFGQLLFVLLTIFVMGGAGFYLGMKFGPQMARWSSPEAEEVKFLPEDALALEIKTLLESTPVNFTFFEVVKDKNNYPSASQSLAADIPIVKIDKPKELAVVETIDSQASQVVSEKTTNSKTATDKVVGESKVPNVAPVEETKLEAPKKEVAQTVTPPLSVAKLEAVKVEPPKVETPKVEDVKKAEAPETTQLAVEELSQTKYLLQIGSYDSAKKAEKAKETWAKRGFSPEIVIAQIPGKGQWYRLRLGLYDDYSVIQTHQKNIQNKYRESAVILPIQ